MKNEIIIFEEEDIKLEVSMQNETVWLTQVQMANLFEKDRSTISEHIKNIFAEEELEEKSNVGFSHIANSYKPVKIYNLNVIISVGYRVKSRRGTKFRIWANQILRDYLLQGHVVNQARLDYLEKTIKSEETVKIRVKFKD